MAFTALADIFKPTPFAGYLIEQSVTQSRLFDSTAVQRMPLIEGLMRQGGETFKLPFWNDLGDAEASPTTDDTTAITPKKITSGEQVGITTRRAEAWSATDLAAAVAADDPMRVVAQGMGRYWARQFQKTTISILRGVIADNIANDSSDMVSDIGTDAVGTPAAAELISSDAIIDAEATMGDAFGAGWATAIFMHSVPYFRLRKQQVIDDVVPANAETVVPMYQGKRVIVDDSMPAVAGANRTEYYTALMGAGAVGFGTVPAKIPVETHREPLQGTGGGIDAVVSRMDYCLHPLGFANTDTPAGDTPTNTEHQDATSWDRVVARKRVPMAFLITNG